MNGVDWLLVFIVFAALLVVICFLAIQNKKKREIIEKYKNTRKAEQKLESWSKKNPHVTLTHTWIIENFSLLPQNTGENLMSLKFSDQSEKMAEWKLQLYPKGINQENKDSISVFLKLQNPQPNVKLSVNFRLTMLNKNDTVLIIGSAVTKEFGPSTGNIIWGHNKFLEQSKITPTTLPDDQLHVKCEVTYAVKQTSGAELLLSSSVSENIIEHFKQLFESKLQSDIVIEVKRKKFDAHKLILGIRSPVFLAMLQSNLTETQTNIVKIEGIEPATFKELLRFIYTDQAEQMDELAEELLAAADRYMLKLLKAKCEAHLAGKITMESCAHLLVLADLHSATGLKTFALDFFCSHTAEVAKTVGWKQFMISANPLLLRDVSNKLISKASAAAAAATQQQSAAQY